MMNTPTRLVALGGLNEVGMNCMVIEDQGAIVLVDCGVTFSCRELGVDLIHPDFSYLVDKVDRIQALIVTHGHEDHIGAIPYFLRRFNVPIYGPAYALALIRARLNEVEPPNEPCLLQIVPRQIIQLGPFQIEPIQSTHSIPNTTGLVLRTSAGTMVHSGDFKIDPNPPDGKCLDTQRLREIGDEGVRLLLSDSTNIDVEGASNSEYEVAYALDARIAEAKGRVIVSLFGSNIHRLQAVLSAAKKHGRQVLLLGRSLLTHHRLAEELGLFPDKQPTFISAAQAMSTPRNKLLVAATGTQGEPRAVLYRLVNKTHVKLQLEEGDEVILSSRVIPGNEYAVFELINKLEHDGIKVWHQNLDPDLHASGHACREEQKKLIELTKPMAFVPIHGTFYHLNRHAQLAREMGIEETLVLDNGTELEIDQNTHRIVGDVHTGRVHIQANHEVAQTVLNDRRLLGQIGIVIAVVNVDAQGSLISKPIVFTRGVVHEEENQEFLEKASQNIHHAVVKMSYPASDNELRDVVCKIVRRSIRHALGFKPLVHCLIVRPT